MKLFTTIQIAELDKLTVGLEPIKSIDLMERAASRITDWITEKYNNELKIIIFAGPGNNGGDALVVARLLAEKNFECSVYLTIAKSAIKGDSKTNLDRLKIQNKVSINFIDSETSIPEINSESIIIDGIFGSGLNRQADNIYLKIINRINSSKAEVISIDIPSGLFGEDNSNNDLNKVIKATKTLTLQFPKISFFFPENEIVLGDWEVIPIGISEKAISQTNSDYNMLDNEFIAKKIKLRSKFSHKGNYGHALLISGSYGKIGAAVLASKACLRTGAGLLTTHVPKLGNNIIQISVPEAMCSTDESQTEFSIVPDLELYNSFGVGPGIGKSTKTKKAFFEFLKKSPNKLVIDADGLNILSENKEWLSILPLNTILTPHPKEFERIFGISNNSYERLLLQKKYSIDYKIIIVLKGAHTCITFPDGSVFFNNTGNPGMATGGSGDVLTGIILGLLAQNYSPENAALIGVYVHGLAGDIAANENGQQTLIAGDIIKYIGKAFLQLE